MANLLRNTRSIIAQSSTISRATTMKPFGASVLVSQGARSAHTSGVAVRSAAQNSAPPDAIRPRPADKPYIPLVGRALNTAGKGLLGLFSAISLYFIYNNYVVNPEFYKSLNVSREADKRDAAEKAAHRGGSGGH